MEIFSSFQVVPAFSNETIFIYSLYILSILSIPYIRRNNDEK